MNIEKRISNLPAKPEDLAKWLLVGKAKLAAQMKALKGINQLTDDVAAVQAALEDTQDLAEILLYAEAGLGRRLEAIPANYKELPSSGGRKPQLPPVDKARSGAGTCSLYVGSIEGTHVPKQPKSDSSHKGTFGGREPSIPEGVNKKQSHYLRME